MLGSGLVEAKVGDTKFVSAALLPPEGDWAHQGPSFSRMIPAFNCASTCYLMKVSSGWLKRFSPGL